MAHNNDDHVDAILDDFEDILRQLPEREPHNIDPAAANHYLNFESFGDAALNIPPSVNHTHVDPATIWSGNQDPYAFSGPGSYGSFDSHPPHDSNSSPAFDQATTGPAFNQTSDFPSSYHDFAAPNGDPWANRLSSANDVATQDFRGRSLSGTGIPDDTFPQTDTKCSSRFPRAAIKILKAWMEAHKAEPYPTEEEKKLLAHETSLSKEQISTWFANARRRSASRGSRNSSTESRHRYPFATTRVLYDPKDYRSGAENGHLRSRSSDSELSDNSRKASKVYRRRKLAKGGNLNDSLAAKMYQCTFCTESFQTKYDWARHEKSLHLSLERWFCAPFGPVVKTAAGEDACAFCSSPNPTREHLDLQHNYFECAKHDISARAFHRKDNLTQHLRVFHSVSSPPSMASWKIEPVTELKSRCGFCKGATLSTWQERIDHLAKHFKEGAQMKSWQGDWGFDPAIAAQVTCAMLPSFIWFEALTPNAYKASSGDIDVPQNLKKGVAQSVAVFGKGRGKLSACWFVMPKILGRWVQEEIAAGRKSELTDDVLKSKIRWFLYGDENDEWARTPGDNPDWLKLFRQVHGLDDDGVDPNSGFGANTLVLMGADPLEESQQDINVPQVVADPAHSQNPEREKIMDECKLKEQAEEDAHLMKLLEGAGLQIHPTLDLGDDFSLM